MEQLSVFNVSKELDDGFKYDNEGKFMGIDINKFTKWWENEKELSKIDAIRVDNTLARAKETIEETNKLIRSALYRENI